MTYEMQTEEVKEEEDKENKEEEKMMMMNKNALLPTVLWAQRRDRIFLTFEIKMQSEIRFNWRYEIRTRWK